MKYYADPFNHSNTARKFYKNPEIVSEILNIPVWIIKFLGLVWNVYTSGLHIKADEFQKLCDDFFIKYNESEINWKDLRKVFNNSSFTSYLQNF